jgi:acetyl esterase/lipase
VRRNAGRLGIDPDRIGIIGILAGGGGAGNSALEFDALIRPNIATGIYPAYRIVTPPPEDAPPLFIATADDRALVAPLSSSRLYEDWHRPGKSVELHVFASGGHGFGARKQIMLSDVWLGLFRNWLATHKYADGAA